MYVKAWFLRAGSQGECAEAPQILAERSGAIPFFPVAREWTQLPCVPGLDLSFITLHLGDAASVYIELERDFSDSPHLKC